MDKSGQQHPGLSLFRLANASRLILLVFVFAALLFSLCACVSLKKSAYPAEIIADPDFELTITQDEYTIEDTLINFEITNGSNDDAIFGAAYALEVLRKGVWYNVPLKGVKDDAHSTWPTIGYKLPAHGANTATISLANHEKVSPGSYRLIKWVNRQSGNQKLIVLAAQFSISKKDTTQSRSSQSNSIRTPIRGPKTLTIQSGDNTILVEAYPLSSHNLQTNIAADFMRYTPQQMADNIKTITLDSSEDSVTPFMAYVMGEEVHGSFELYNSRYEQIPYLEVPGQAPQTYLFKDAKPGKYIVVMYLTFTTADYTSTYQYFFGVNVTTETNSCVHSANEVNFPHNINYVLPDGMTAGEFDQYLGMGGGIPLYNKSGAICGCLEIHLYGSSIFANGELSGVTQFAHHAWFTSEFIPVTSGMPCVAVKYSQSVYDEETSQYIGERELWYAFWAKEGFEPIYALCLYADAYDFEDLQAITESVTFSEDAFVRE